VATQTPDRAVFLDRDGVINRKAPEGDYIKSWPELELLPGVGEAIARLNGSGYLVWIITNQRGVARGLMSERELSDIHQRMTAQLAAEGAIIDGISVCLHDHADRCDCRKPKPGMLLRAAEARGLRLGRSWMIGDRPSDIGAGRAAGCRTILVGPLIDDPQTLAEAGPDHRSRDLAESSGEDNP
jgi:D-glycero-D-manno-heptose 1,7-bisphosphate phosphatase